MKHRKFRIAAGGMLLLASLAGCSTDRKADAAQPVERKEGSVDPRPSVVETPAAPYQAVAVTDGVRLSGTVDFEGQLPPDSIIHVPADAQGCGRTSSIPAIERSGTKVGGVVVWLADIRTGKALPIERRFDLANNECLLSPRVQAVFAPATLNVASIDVGTHRNHIIDVASGELRAIAPFNDNGEVIPFDSLLVRPAELEVTCTLHPWAKAWILVFDHPYFSVSERNGAFAMDNVPPGTYRLKAWHPLVGATEQTVTVAAGQPVTLDLKLGRAPAAPPATQPPAAAPQQPSA